MGWGVAALALGATHTLTHAVETAVRRAAPEVKAVQVHPRPASTGGPVA